jgi:NIPSNAP
MSLNIKYELARIGGGKRTGWRVCGAALLSFAAGSLLTAHWAHMEDVKADSHRVFQLEIYHAVPGKVPALEERFRSASQLQAKHHLDVIGYWVPTDSTSGNTDPAFANTFVYLVAHANQEDAKKNWDTFHSDPAFQEYVKSERSEKLIEGVDSTFMRPTDYSVMK